VEIQVTNTLTRRKESLIPLKPGHISMYVCGVTPYDATHVGHARPAVVFDVVRRFLRHKGFQVRLVQNFTDIDDKIIARAAEKGVAPLELANTYSQEYLNAMDRLGVERADAYPRVSEHIPDIIAMIQELIRKEFAYVENGDVYFSVSRFPEYGKLSNQKLEELEAGTRFDVDERKRHPADFALWKAAKPGEPAWDSPWGPGRPGWHIECSAMAYRYLGAQIDIHGGGVDLVFPHHENEIAQSEAFSGQVPFVRFWLHNGLVNMHGEKMSKSLGNFLTVEDVLNKYPAELLRYFILSHHYRSAVDFAPERLEAAEKGWRRLNALVWELRELNLTPEWPGLSALWSGKAQLDSRGLGAAVDKAVRDFDAAMSDDLNTPKAIAVLFDVVREVRGTGMEADGVELAWAFLEEAAGDILGILGEQTAAIPEEGLNVQLLELLIELRNEARKHKDWEQADRIRDRLKELGIILEDTPSGTRWVVQNP
jgi:cysteinyl-tRNA synthetase